MSDENKKKLKKAVSPIKLFNLGAISFVFAIIFAGVAIIFKPKGQIDESVLWFVAQLLVYSAGCLAAASGINAILSSKFINFQIDADRNGVNDLKK